MKIVVPRPTFFQVSRVGIQQKLDRLRDSIAKIASAVGKVNVTGTDTTLGYLSQKLVAGAGITLTPQNLGGNETLQVAAPGSTTDEQVKVTALDTTPGFLQQKVQPGSNVSLSVVSPGGNEQLRIDVPEAVVRIPSIAALKAIDTTGYPLGACVWLADMMDFYFLDNSGAIYIPDDIVVIQPTIGGGYWLSYAVGRWDDLVGDISQGVGTTALTYEAWQGTPPAGFPSFFQYFFRHDQADQLSFRYQMPHKWLVDTGVRPHLHITPCANPAVPQTIALNGLFVWTLDAVVIPPLNTWTTFTATHIVNPGAQLVPTAILLSQGSPNGEWVPPPGTPVSSILRIVMQRVTTAADTYSTNKPWGTGSANVALDSSDLHFRYRPQGTVLPLV